MPYPAHSTAEEGKALRGQMSGRFTKNLLAFRQTESVGLPPQEGVRFVCLCERQPLIVEFDRPGEAA